MTQRKDPRRRTLRLAIGGVLLSAIATGCSTNYEVPVNRTPAPPIITHVPAAPTPTKSSMEPSEAPPTVTSPPSPSPEPTPDPTPTPKPSPRPSQGHQGSIGTALVGGYVATFCAPTANQCQNWGGNVAYAAVRSFHSGMRPYWVKVSYRQRSVRVLVVSYCACGLRRGHSVIDLSPAAMAVLEPDYRRLGVLRYVEIEGLR